MKNLDSSSFVPLYHQLKEIIVENIENNVWNPDDKIPSEHQLSEHYCVSRNTTKRAIDDLVQEGVLYRVQGTGTFVTRPKIEQSLSGFYSFSKVLKEKGLKPTDTILEIKVDKVPPQVAQELGMNRDEDVVVLRRLRCANGEPIILETSYIPNRLVGNIDQMKLVGEKPLYDILADEYDILVTSAKETFEPVLIKPADASFLQVKQGSPVLLLERVAFDQRKMPVEYCKSIVRGDRCRFYTELI
ncbi:GntR family transcriptional regulator [Neobacillus sp. NPDC097160]|uniref:GntR family transcriptional regulator n=1 Tax=Neobacillus sp. NPDC097160 TaxID=3364298 RepID=UPI0038210259